MPDIDVTAELSCPSCGTMFRIPRKALGGAGRDVRCSRCATVWRATAPEPVPEKPAALHIVRPETVEGGRNAREHARETRALNMLPPEEAPPLVPHAASDLTDAPFHEPEPAPEVRPAARRTPRPAAKTRKPRRLLPRPATLVATLALAALGGLYAGRQQVVRHFPAAAAVYAMAGIDVNLRGMTFTDLKTTREIEDGVPVLLVDGMIRSALDRPADVPRLRLGLKDGAGKELYSWTAATPAAKIEPLGALPFRARLAAPPVAAASLEVRFLDKADLARPH